MKKISTNFKITSVLVIILICVALVAYFFISRPMQNQEADSGLSSIPTVVDNQEFADLKFSGEPYVTINENNPEFDEKMKTEESFEYYGPLDDEGRCTVALANLSKDTAPAEGETRQDISEVHPSGWMSNQGWERCHLIGWQLCNENANANNLITGTHYLNSTGMLPFENQVASYIENTGNHVLYRVTPVYRDKNLVASGVHMEAESVEDDGEGLSFNVYCFNVTPGAEIDYSIGLVINPGDEEAYREPRNYVLNTNSKKFHYPSCSSVGDMSEANKEYVKRSRIELIREGYAPCGACEP